MLFNRNYFHRVISLNTTLLWTKFRPNTPLLTNHRTTDQSNLMSLVKRSVLEVLNFVITTCTLISRCYGRNLDDLGLGTSMKDVRFFYDFLEIPTYLFPMHYNI